MIFPLDARIVAAEIGIPISGWSGNCHAVATSVLRKMPIAGMRLVRGHYLGYVDRSSGYSTCGIQQHSWLELEDGRILDPTRWAMSDPERPSIWLGTAEDYDEAGLCARARARPQMAFANLLAGGGSGPADAVHEAMMKAPASSVSALLSAIGRAPDDQVSKVAAQRVYDMLQGPVEHLSDRSALMEAAEAAGLRAFVPIDSWIRVMEPEKVTPSHGVNFFYDAPPLEAQSRMQKLFRVFCMFLSIEERGDIERELDEFGYQLEELHDALNDMERWLRFDPALPYMERGHRDTICVVAMELLGKGFGEELRVERFARSAGLSRDDLHNAMREFGDGAGFDLPWLIGEEARRAEAVELPSEFETSLAM